ncbi:MAG: MarR family winged helix-turn-helix transcriptional regulator [Minwuia sp.]|uniref:MarR family winged helix-turn-helix transcriptional regulator n=1 Tax=Minwuia sp. TaxID=2493630 RepID=UPI003A88EB78
MPDSHQSFDASQEAAHRYRSVTRMIERLHRLYLDVIRAELTRLRVDDISAVQALLLTNIGEAEVNVKTLMERGYYQGSNATYNLKKLVEAGYIEQFKSQNDRRATIVRVTGRGRDLSGVIQKLEAEFADGFEGESGDLGALLERLSDLEHAWSHHIRVCALG